MFSAYWESLFHDALGHHHLLKEETSGRKEPPPAGRLSCKETSRISLSLFFLIHFEITSMSVLSTDCTHERLERVFGSEFVFYVKRKRYKRKVTNISTVLGRTKGSLRN